MALGERARSLLKALLKLLTIVAIGGATGVGIGLGLTQLSDDEGLSGPMPGAVEAATTTQATTASTRQTATTAATPQPVTTTTTTTATQRPPAQVELRVLGAILRPAGTASGRRRQRSRLILRIQANNGGERSMTLRAPILRVGSVRLRLDPAANPPEAQLRELGPGETTSTTLRYELSGDATRKVTTDRRARLDAGARSIALRVTIGAPVRPAGQPPAP